MQFIRKIKERIKVFGIWPTIMYLFFTVFLEKIGFHAEAILVFHNEVLSYSPVQKFSFRVIQSASKLGDKERASLIEYGGKALIDDFSTSFARGELCALGYWEHQLGCVCWGKKIQHHPILGRKPVFLIWRCFTLPELRGRGLYPLTLSHFCSELNNRKLFFGPILIECSIFNQSSMKGIQKAGFRYQGKILRFGSWRKSFDVQNINN